MDILFVTDGTKCPIYVTRKTSNKLTVSSE